MLRQRYRVIQTLGQGGMGAVYAAQYTQLGDRLIAVKEMSTSRLMPQEIPQAVAQFQHEAYLLASLHHPNLPVIHEYFQEDERWYLVMSFIEGRTLQAVLDSAPGKKLPFGEVVRIGIELCEVLKYLHTHNPPVIFRDLKPLNIMLTPSGHICLIDFGIARHFKQDQAKDTAYYYSIGYAPPEQYGQSQTGPRSDIYSLGATLHHMLSGQNPALKPFQFAPLQQVDPTLPMSLSKLIAQMVEMNEQARLASVAQVKIQLGQVLAPAQIEPTKPAITHKTEKPQTEQTEQSAIAPSLTIVPAPSIPWKQRDRLLSKRRSVAWIGFIILSLTFGGLLPLIAYVHNANTYLINDHWPFFLIWGPGETYVPDALFESSIHIMAPYTVIISALGAASIGFLFLLLN
jgi:serine/threonine protein kinase